MDRINEYLYIGDVGDATKRKSLKQEKIDLVVDVRSHFDEVKDIPLPSIWRLTNAVMDVISKGYRVLLFCRDGINGSPFAAMMVMKLYHGSSYADAYNSVVKKRPQTICHPEWVEEIKRW